MVQLVLIVHAETAATRRAAFPAGEGLTAQGLDAARRLAGPPRREVALRSPAEAARETAEAMGLAAAPEPALRDCDAGRWAGSTLAAVAAADPDAAAAFLGDPGYAGHGGESIDALLRRVAAFLEHRRGARERLVAVTHGAVARAAVVAALGAPADAFFRIDAPPLARVALSCDGRRWVLRAEPFHRG